MTLRVSTLKRFIGGGALLAQFTKLLPTEAIIVIRDMNRHDFDFAIRYNPPTPTAAAALPPAYGDTASEPFARTLTAHNSKHVVGPPFSIPCGSLPGASGGPSSLVSEGYFENTRPASQNGNEKKGAIKYPSWFSCAALFYPWIPHKPTQVGGHNLREKSKEEERVLDTFVLALKLSDTESILRGVIGEHSYATLVGPVIASQAQIVSLHVDHRDLMPYSMSAAFSMRAGSAGTQTPIWLAHTLLTTDEENRVKWLWEEMDNVTACYARVPTLRSLFALWHIASAEGEGAGRLRPSCCPSSADVAQACQRMRDRSTEITLCDVAALGMFGAANKKVRKEVLTNFLGKVQSSQVGGLAVDARDCTSQCDKLELVLIILFLLKYMGKHHGVKYGNSSVLLTLDDAEGDSDVILSLLSIATQISAYKEKLICKPINHRDQPSTTEGGFSSPEPTPTTRNEGVDADAGDVYQTTLVCVMEYFLNRIGLVAAQCDTPVTSPYIYDMTLWLLREMPHSDACFRNFRRVVEHSPAEALLLLEKSNLLSKSRLNLQSVVEVLLPLLKHCEKEDFLSTVMQEVLIALERRLWQDLTSFTQGDMKWLSALGTSLFTVSVNEAVIGASSLVKGAHAQVEELNVMDGSPWALCVATYRSLKEIIWALSRDQRSLRQQVEKQVRAIAKAAGRPRTTQVKSIASQAPEAIWESTDPSSTSSAVGGRQLVRGDVRSPAGAPSVGTSHGEIGDYDEDHAMPEQWVLEVSASVRHRFLLFLEKLVKTLVDARGNGTGQPIVVSSELFDFVKQNVPVPNIQDEYRRKIFLLVNVTSDEKTMRERTPKHKQEARGRRRTNAASQRGEEGDDELEEATKDEHVEVIPAELRFLVNSLPLVLSPWASVMVLREVLAESPGGNPRYTYILNAAIDLQLPISTTRSRIATTLNMWRFLNTQTHKLSLKESVMVKQRCVLNLPLSYILSSYWSLLTWLILASLIVLNIVGLDVESQLVANKLFDDFGPWDEIVVGETEPWCEEAAADVVSEYVNLSKPENESSGSVSLLSSDKILSSASYIFLGSPDQCRPMTIMPIGSDPRLKDEVRVAEEYACATAVLKKMSSCVVFPFYVDLPRTMPVEYIEAQVAERIRRVSLNNAWLLLRTLIRTFPLGREHMERTLISHTCAQANLTHRRITFLVYIHYGVPISAQFLRCLENSLLAQNANLVLVVHECSLLRGGITPERLCALTKDASKSVNKHKEKQGYIINGSEKKRGGLQVLPCSRELSELRHVALCGRGDVIPSLSLFGMHFVLRHKRVDSHAGVEAKADDLKSSCPHVPLEKTEAIVANNLKRIFEKNNHDLAVPIFRDNNNLIGACKSEFLRARIDPIPQWLAVKHLSLAEPVGRSLCHRMLIQWKNYVKRNQKPLLSVPQSGLPLCSDAARYIERKWLLSHGLP